MTLKTATEVLEILVEQKGNCSTPEYIWCGECPLCEDRECTLTKETAFAKAKGILTRENI